VSGASDALDPIAAAEAGIAGSKHLIASVANDLSQQERWLAHYRVAERRRERQAKIREVMYWLELRRQRLMRWLRREALIALRLARTAAAFLWRNAVALCVIVRDTATACFVWLRPRVYALALILAAWTLALLAWTATEIRLLAHAAGKAAAGAAVWIAQRSRVLGTIMWQWLVAAWAWARIETARLARASITGASIASAWSAAQSRAGAAALHRESTRLASWTRKKAGHFSRASLATASLGFSWANQAGGANNTHRALVIRRSTALISFEPRPAHWPALSRRTAPRPVSSRAVHASP
jgi:hypothetical protein